MRSPLCRLLPALTCAATLIAAAPAAAEFYPSVPIDGPSADIGVVGGLDISRDGQGGIVYTRKVDGVPRVFAARFAGGRFGAPVQLDGGLAGTSGEPVIGAADGGRMAAAFVTDGTLFTTVFVPSANAWSTPQPIGPGSHPSIDLSIHGAGFVTFTSGGDVRAARLERGQTAFGLFDAPLDYSQPQVAGEGNGRSRVAIGADSTAVAVWGEDGRVYARRLYRKGVSTSAVEPWVGVFDGRAGQGADLPDVDIEDDSSFAEIVFRQAFDRGDGVAQMRGIARRLRGSRLDDPVAIDGSVWGADDVAAVDVDLNGRGEGLAMTGRDGGTVTGSVLKADVFAPGLAIGAAGTAPSVAGAAAETAQRVASWTSPGDGTVRSRYYDDRTARRSQPAPGPDTVVSSPELGPVDPAGGFAAASDRVGDFMTAFVQGQGDARRIVYSVYDRAPTAFSVYSSGSWRNPARVPIAWSAATDLWGGATYVIYINGREVGRTTATRFSMPPALAGDGVHTLSIAAVDQHGQSVSTPVRPLRLDGVAPKLSFRVDRSKRRVTVRAKASDVLPRSGRASGVKYVRISFGDGSRRVQARTASHTYGKTGPMTIRVSATDRAGNATVVTRRITIPKAGR